MYGAPYPAGLQLDGRDEAQPYLELWGGKSQSAGPGRIFAVLQPRIHPPEACRPPPLSGYNVAAGDELRSSPLPIPQLSQPGRFMIGEKRATHSEYRTSNSDLTWPRQ